MVNAQTSGTRGHPINVDSFFYGGSIDLAGDAATMGDHR